MATRESWCLDVVTTATKTTNFLYSLLPYKILGYISLMINRDRSRNFWLGAGSKLWFRKDCWTFCGKLLLTETTTCFSICERRPPLAREVLFCERRRTDHRRHRKTITFFNMPGIGIFYSSGVWWRGWGEGGVRTLPLYPSMINLIRSVCPVIFFVDCSPTTK